MADNQTPTLMGLRIGQATLTGELALLRSQQTTNHQQNRSDIHDLRETTQGISEEVSEVQKSVNQINIRLARLGGMAAAGGAGVAVIVKLIDHLWK